MSRRPWLPALAALVVAAGSVVAAGLGFAARQPAGGPIAIAVLAALVWLLRRRTRA